MRPDSYHYTAIPFDQTEFEVMWTVVRQIGDWLDLTVQSGWQVTDYTGKDKGTDTGHFREVLGSVNTTWNPLSEIWNDGAGDALPSDFYDADNSFAKTVYLRWDDGEGTEQNINVFDYYLTTVHLYNSVAFNELRVGCLLDKAESVFFYGSVPNFMTYSSLTGWGPPPEANEGPEGLYPYWPTQGSHDIPPAPISTSGLVHAYTQQPGYLPNSERIGNYNTYGQDDICTAHCFAGVDKGAPYLFIIIESTTPDYDGQVHSYYFHCGVGNVVKHGNWKGGQWATTTYNYGATNTIDSLNSDYNSRMFDNVSARYAPSTSKTLIYASTDMAPYDSNDPDSRPDQFYFGSYPTSNTNVAWGCTTGGMLGDQLTQWDHSRANYRTPLWHNYIRIRDPDNYNYYFLAGVVPCQRLAKNRYIQPGAEYTEGGVTWKVFPLRSRVGVPTNTPHSSWYAAAYRIN